MTRARPRAIRLVQGDTAPPLRLSITDPNAANAPVDLSAAGTTVRFKLRPVPQGGENTTIKATITCSKLAGYVNADGTINTAPPYNVPGAGGRCQVDWTPTALDTDGSFEAEIEITFDTGLIQTLPTKIAPIIIRKQFT